ncbi:MULTISPECIES: pyridoxamine 5'-phosphate oxidase family protein [unclassified Nocardioides]|uniref:pyridoxamine 5'-phosphate oxidase family protein n=1 Tax=unclassified Nocardioides TaxID=2615069 RepID=UPI00361CE746
MGHLQDHAAELLAQNAYLTLGTVGPDGRPWASPVYFAADGVSDFYWSSTPVSRHSENLAAHPAVSLVVFDSTVPPYHGRALYADATAEVLAGDDLERGLAVYPGSPERGGTGLTADELSGSSPWRLYRARATEVSVLCPREPRQPCPLHGRNDDHRARVWPETAAQG